MNLNEADAQALAAKVIALSKADSCVVEFSGYDNRHIRYAQNMATTSGAPGNIGFGIESHFGKHVGSASGNDLSDEGLAALVAASEKTAKLAPENPEFLPPLGPQKYAKGVSFAPVTEAASPEMLAASVQPVLRQAQEQHLQASGFLEVGASFSCFATSKGLFAYHRSTSVQHTLTARTPDGTGSGWAGTTHYDFSQLDAAALGAVAMDKAVRSHKPAALPPGKYTVILEPSAVADLVGLMIRDEFDARSADEGRNFATKKGGGSRLGESVFGKNISIYSDPSDPLVPGTVYSDDGLPAEPVAWVENGVLKNLTCSRYWAQKSKYRPVSSPTTLAMKGGTTSTAEMVKQTKKGLLITRFWYIREVDPQTVLFTGLTRDGVFLIENGEITRPVQNFRFNESPVAMLNRVMAMGPSVRAYGEEVGNFPISVPTLLVDGFALSSVSDAV